MKLGKSLLLGSAAAVMGAAGAQAADLPVRKAAPVDYVRVCDWAGTGFFYIPGTDTCIQVGGLVRVEGAFINNARQYYPTPTNGPNQRSTAGTTAAGTGGGSTLIAGGTTIPGRGEDTSGFFVRGRIAVDTRTQTAYGTVRAYVRYQIDRLQGVYQGGGIAGGQNTFANQGGNSAYLDKGYIQFAGTTAGRVQSLFDFYADDYNFEGIANSDLTNNVFAYTYTGAGGFSATLSIEDHNQRNDGIGSITGGAFRLPDSTAQVTVNGTTTTPEAIASANYAGETIPDIVGVLRLDQAWGSAQLSAAYHQVNTVAGPFVGTGGQGFNHRDADGFAVQAGIDLKLPMLAAGDDLWLEGAYQNGAYLYQDSVGYANAGFQSRYLGGFQHIDHDAIAIGNGTGNGGYNLSLSTGFSVMAALSHFFTPTVQNVLFGSYEQTSYGRARLIDWTNGGLGDMSEYRVGDQINFFPVKNLQIGVEFDYAHIDQTLAHDVGFAATALPAGVTKNPDGFEARLRMERDF